MNMDILINIMTALSALFAVFINILYFHQYFYFFIFLFTKARSFPEAKKNHYFTFVIAAHDEEKVIGNLIDSIQRQNYPKELFNIVVIADACSDHTAQIAKDNGAIVIERNQPDLPGKSYALDYGYKFMLQDERFAQTEAFCVFDADNVVDKSFLAEMNRAYDSGSRICTGFRSTKNFDNFNSAGQTISFFREMSIIHKGRNIFKLGTFISGTGFFISKDLIQQMGGFPYHLMTEDIELSADFALKGIKINFCDKAVFYDEQPCTFRDSCKQRIRWLKGTIQVFAKYHRALLKKAITKHDQLCLELYAHTFPIAIAVPLSAVIFTSFSVVMYFFGYISTRDLVVNQLVLSDLLPMLELAIVLILESLYVVFVNNKRIQAPFIKKVFYAILFPLFMATYLPLSWIALFSTPKWEKIEHNISRSIDDFNDLGEEK